MTLFYVANDVIQYARRKKVNDLYTILKGAIQDVVPEDVLEVERGGSTRPRSRNVSPLVSCSSIRTDRVCHLPKDESFHLLSPNSKRRANQLHLAPEQEYMRSAIARSLAPSSRNPTPQARVGKFLENLFLGKN